MDIGEILDSSDVPTPPGPALRVIEIKNDPESGIDDLVEVVRHDPALAAKIMATANSPAYRRGDPVTSVERAVRVLGFRSVTTVALALSVASTMPVGGVIAGVPMPLFWKRSVLTAGAARLIATEVQKDLAEEAFFVGLIAGLGRIIMGLTVPEEYEPLADAHDGWPSLLDEREAFGLSSASLTGALLRKWGMPELLAGAIELVESVEGDTTTGSDDQDLARIVRLATEITSFLVEEGDGAQLQAIIRGAGAAGIGAHAIDQVLDEVYRNVGDLAEEFEIPADEAYYAEIIKNARDGLLEISLQTDMDWNIEQTKRREVEQAAARLETEVRQDPLTGLWNRRAFDEQLSRQLSMRLRNPGDIPKKLGVIMIDIDHFKAINDTYGHPAGDAVLRTLARVLTASTRAEETVSRYGGEEFILLAPTVTEDELALAGERLRATIERTEVELPTGDAVSVTASFGGAALDRVDTQDDGPQLVKAADEALYEAKAGGRNRVVVATDWP